MAASNRMKQLMLDAIFNSGQPVTVSLHTADPGTTGASEVTGGGYSRKTATFGATALGDFSDNDADITFTNLPSCTVTHVGLWRNNEFMQGGSLTQSRVVAAGDGLYFSTGQLRSILNG